MPRAARCRTVDWDWEVFLEDSRVQAMPPLALGVWTRILGALARAERPGRLTGEEDVLRRAGHADASEWAEVSRLILPCLNRKGLQWIHRKTVREHARQTARVKSSVAQKVAAGKRSAAARYQRAVERPLNGCSVHVATAVQPPSFLPSVTPTKKIKTCSERFASEPPPAPISLQALSGEWWTPTDAEVADWRVAYPAVDLEQAAAAMRAWLAANKSRRKTLRGLPRFAATWLAREQDRPHANGAAAPTRTTEDGLPLDGSDGWGTPETWRRG